MAAHSPRVNRGNERRGMKLEVGNSNRPATTTAAIWYIATIVACGLYGVGRTRSVACCDATNRAGGNFSFPTGIDGFFRVNFTRTPEQGQTYHLKQTSGQTPKKLLQHRSPLAKRLRDCRRTGSTEGCKHGLPSKPGSLTQEGEGLLIPFYREGWLIRIPVFADVFLLFCPQ